MSDVTVKCSHLQTCRLPPFRVVGRPHCTRVCAETLFQYGGCQWHCRGNKSNTHLSLSLVWAVHTLLPVPVAGYRAAALPPPPPSPSIALKPVIALLPLLTLFENDRLSREGGQRERERDECPICCHGNATDVHHTGRGFWKPLMPCLCAGYLNKVSL